MLEIRNLYKKYDRVIFDDVSYKFNDTGLYIITGSSGIGKSTLLNILSRVDEKYEGNIYYNNQDIKDIKDFRRNYVGYLFQDFNLIEDYSVKENVSITKYLNKVGKHFIKSMFDKYQFIKYQNKNINKLSGGEKQRVALIRTLAKKPSIILADEPSGSLDNKNAEFVFEQLKEFSKSCLVIVITHDSTLAKKYADTLIKLEDKKFHILKTATNKGVKASSDKKVSRFYLLSFKEVIKNFKLNYKVITGIYLALFCILLIFSVVDGTKIQLKKEVSKLLPDSLLIIDGKNLKSITKIKGVKYTYLEPSNYEFLGLDTKDNYSFDNTIYISEQYNYPPDNLYKKIHSDNDIIISKTTALKLFNKTKISNKKVYGYYSDGIQIKKVTYNIVGVSNNDTLLDTMYIKENSNVRLISELFNDSDISFSVGMICVDSKYKVKTVKKELENKYPNNKIKISNDSINKNIDDITSKISIVLTFFSLLAVVSSCFLIGEVMYLSVVQRKRKIGIFRYLGASSNEIKLNIIFESLIIVLISFLLAYYSLVIISGSISDILSNELFNKSVNLIIIDNRRVVIILMITTLLTVVSSYLPARYACRLDILEDIN
ncbi:MAG: ATP-binding cassette domain-containing protein [Thomasclavelia sp.]|nr:ATP-binding cassette domain-containing protein [Thomasclavelia sp.]